MKLERYGSSSRREFLCVSGTAAAMLAWPQCLLGAETKKDANAQPDEASGQAAPAEDLLREHAVLDWLLLIYGSAEDALNAGGAFPPEVLKESTGIIQRFIEDYHEKLEEDYLFPRFRKANALVDLVDTLDMQHKSGRVLTRRIADSATAEAFKDPGKRTVLVADIHAFTRMYRPHAAREGTVLFPALRTIVSPRDYADMGESFEDKENELFGDRGFFRIVDEVAALEQKVGLYDLSQYMPKA